MKFFTYSFGLIMDISYNDNFIKFFIPELDINLKEEINQIKSYLNKKIEPDINYLKCQFEDFKNKIKNLKFKFIDLNNEKNKLQNQINFLNKKSINIEKSNKIILKCEKIKWNCTDNINKSLRLIKNENNIL
jgi:chromosome segregation ATPase